MAACPRRLSFFFFLLLVKGQYFENFMFGVFVCMFCFLLICVGTTFVDFENLWFDDLCVE